MKSRNNTQNLIALAIAALVSLTICKSAFAEESKTVGTLVSSNAAPSWGAVRPFLSGGLGFMGQNSDQKIEGIPAQVKLLGSYEAPFQWLVLDAGLGLSGQQFSKADAPAAAKNGTMLEVAARYQWMNRIQAGPVANVLFSQGKVYGANQGDLHLFGAQIMKETDLAEKYVLRYGVRGMIDSNVRNQTVSLVMAEVAIGWNPYGKAANVKTAPAVDAAISMPAKPIAAVEQKPTPILPKIVALEKLNGALLFASGKTQLSAKAQAQVKAMAKVLAKSGDFESLEVIGHTDSSGSEELNMKISKQRAEHIRNLMIQGGMNPTKVAVSAKGESELLVNSENAKEMAKNRRGEVFAKTKNEESMRQLR